jgi:hypothetical protein
MTPATVHAANAAPTLPVQRRTIPGDAKIPLPMISAQVNATAARNDRVPPARAPFGTARGDGAESPLLILSVSSSEPIVEDGDCGRRGLFDTGRPETISPDEARGSRDTSNGALRGDPDSTRSSAILDRDERRGSERRTSPHAAARVMCGTRARTERSFGLVVALFSSMSDDSKTYVRRRDHQIRALCQSLQGLQSARVCRLVKNVTDMEYRATLPELIAD